MGSEMCIRDRSYWQVILNRKPELGEKITIGTFATEFKGLFGNRNFYMKDADGKYLACANSVWAFIDTETGRPTSHCNYIINFLSPLLVGGEIMLAQTIFILVSAGLI